MSDNKEETKCPFLAESKCPMSKCPYMKGIKVEDAKNCPYLQKSKCPYFKNEGGEDNGCKDGVCPFK